MSRPTEFEDLSDYDQQEGEPLIEWLDTNTH